MSHCSSRASPQATGPETAGKAAGGGPTEIGGYRAGAFPYYVLVDAGGKVAGHGHLTDLLEKVGIAAMLPPAVEGGKP